MQYLIGLKYHDVPVICLHTDRADCLLCAVHVTYLYMAVRSVFGYNTIAKGRMALTVSSGLGMRKNGLNMISCNLICWFVAIPILAFVSKIWTLNDKEHENIPNF